MDKRQYGNRQPKDMISALDEFRKEKVKLNECCRKYNIPKKAFIRHLQSDVERGNKAKEIIKQSTEGKPHYPKKQRRS
ncbi:hypothetical protein PR048_014232 [Dryococelus australis]|uniref:Uncharacterized protein n=1 Tax=Dryococelus australis TaxID=614101 RepID=A0ABQ9HDT7_9NEOP|nr:hypothetical protein PR048_014232 [Dryococelus australis]